MWNCRRIECVNFTIEFEYIHRPSTACQIHHIEGELLKDAVVAIPINIGESDFGYWIPTKSKMKAFGQMGFQCDNQVT
jgi:hypothetical protein